jgi:branched-chain amino acid transport system substrate-binding protein
VSYAAKTTQLTSEVQALKASNPILVLQSSYTAASILSMKTY